MPTSRSDLILEALADTLASKTAKAEAAGSLPVALALTSTILDFSTTLGQLPAGSRGDADAFLGMLAQKTSDLGALPLVVPVFGLPLEAGRSVSDDGTVSHFCERVERVTCGGCGSSWCERCDPGPSALCHTCHGRGHSTAPLGDTDARQ